MRILKRDKEVSDLNGQSFESSQIRLKEQLRANSIVPEGLVDEIIDRHTRVTCARDQRVSCQALPADPLFWVVSGLVDVSCPEEDGSQILVWVAGPGDLIGFTNRVDEDERLVQPLPRRPRRNAKSH